jgi:mono/diheme cytochrome c family protein
MNRRIRLSLVLSAILVCAACDAADSTKAASKPPAPSSATQPAAPAAPAAKPTPVAPAVAPAAAPAAAPPTAAAPTIASDAQIAELSKPSGGTGGGLYTVKDGSKVDDKTLAGWKTWRALACERCHGAEQEGLVGPPLVVSLHRLTKEEFKKTITDGRIEKGMPPFSASKMVMDNWEGLYAYLKGRADGQIKPGHLYALNSPKK